MIKNIFSLKVILPIILSFFLTTVIVLAWTEPSGSPPYGNVSAPINVGPTGQTKSGGLILNTGGAKYGLIVATGTVGIGTTEPSPSYQLDVAGWIKARGGVDLSNDGILRVNRGLVFITESRVVISGGQNPVNISGKAVNISGNVKLGGPIGVGTEPSPEYHLDVAGKIRGKEFCLGNDCISKWPSVTGGTQTGGGVVTGLPNAFVSIADEDGNVQFSAKGADILRIGAGEGLKVSFTPDEKAFSYTLSEVNWNKITNFPKACPPGQFVTAIGETLTCTSTQTQTGGINGSGEENYLAKFTGDKTIGKSQIYDSGAGIGIGTTTPVGRLSIVGGPIGIYSQGSLYDIGIYFQGSAYDIAWKSGESLQIGEYDGTNYIERMRITTGGNVGIGTASPKAKLHVAGNIYGTNDLYIDGKVNTLALRLQPSLVPPEPTNGVIYYDANENKFKCYQNNQWMDCIGGVVGVGGKVEKPPLVQEGAEEPAGKFNYRRLIIIDNTQNPMALKNYQISLTLDTKYLFDQGKMRSDCGDLRFLDSDGKTYLNYWIESGCKTNNTKIWVKVPFINGGETKIIYAYYGNPSATDESNEYNTFIKFGIKFDGPISAGRRHTCALVSNGTVKCWGADYAGQLGDGATDFAKKNYPVSVSVGDITNAVAIAVGDEHTCALLSNGTVKCWGGNAKGQLGNGGTNTSTIPVPVSGITNAIAITAGAEHTCALLSDGTVKCWGRNDAGQLGNGTKNDSSTPVPVKDLTNAIAITAGGFHTCALLSNGTVKCWGWNAKGQLGDGTIATKVSPVQVQEQGNAVLKNVVAIKAGWVHTCALLSNGTVKCWGDNGSGQISVSYIHTSQVSTVALDVPDLKNAVAIAAGENHTCALLSNGTVKCWGGNNKGQLGNGTTQTSAYGTQVIEEGGSVLKNAVAIAAGAYHTCALLSGGIAKCWGSDEYGQLGDNDWRTTESLYAKNVYATFNFGGRYDKTNGIPATIQKPPYSDIYQNGDKYFIRAHAAPEPKVRLGEEQQVQQQTSDISLKKDIQPLNFGILDKVLRLNPVSFYWKDESIDKNKHFGFIAQEVEQVLPELVRQDFQGKKTLNYDEFIPYLVKAIQEQQQIIQKQQKEIEELKEMIKR